MLIESHKYTSFENEFRQSLRRGYNRLRLAQGQWLKLEGAELILELLGDLQVLDFSCNHTNGAAKFSLPFVYIVPWRADMQQPIVKQLIIHNREVLGIPEKTVSPYRRLLTLDVTNIHREIGKSLRDHLSEVGTPPCKGS